MISPSSQMLEKLREYGVIRRASVISTGLPPKCFQVIADNNFRTEYGIAEEAFLLLYVGRVAYEKNIEFLIAMFRQVRAEIDQAILLVAGEGPALGDLRKRAKHSGVGEQIRFIGYLDRESALLECYQASDVFVFASQTETQGLVLLEAMASGLPVVSTASMGSLDVLTEGEGCLISPLEAEPFAARVVSLARDQDGRHELARRGIAYARGWGSTVKAEELIGFYEQTLQTEPQVGDVSNAGSTIEAEPNEP